MTENTDQETTREHRNGIEYQKLKQGYLYEDGDGLLVHVVERRRDNYIEIGIRDGSFNHGPYGFENPENLDMALSRGEFAEVGLEVNN